MKRLGSSDSLGALMSVCPTSADEHNQGNSHVYPREFQSMLEGLDEEGCVEESGHIPEKKRRLSVDQVKALEKNFEVENKLEPERKVKLAQELGLQPRQVAVWFQNRRARWKTKQLERDYGILKANYESLKHSYESLQHDNEALVKEIRELKGKLQEDKMESKISVKEEEGMMMMVSDECEEERAKRAPPQMVDIIPECCDDEEDDINEATDLNFESFKNNNGGGGGLIMGSSLFTDFKDGSSDSDSSAILNEENNNNNISTSPNNNAAISSSSAAGGGGGVGGILVQSPHQFFNCSSINGFQFSTDSKEEILLGGDATAHKAEAAASAYQPQFVKIEEHNFFSGDESCSTFFSDDQPPSLHWGDCPEDWN